WCYSLASSFEQLRSVALAAARAGGTVAAATLPPVQPARVVPPPSAEPGASARVEGRVEPPGGMHTATPSARWLDDVLVDQLLSDEHAMSLLEAELEARAPE